MTEKTLIIATNNAHKLEEMQRILAPLGLRAISQNDAGITLSEVDETGETFEENAFLKAEAAVKQSGLPAIADDSGLCVDALQGAPGVYSARYAGGHGDSQANIEKLLSELDGVPKEKRSARFVCAICCLFPNGRKIEVRETCEGKIAEKQSGEKGFGYDPVFITEEGCFAEIDGAQKDEISHRGKALRALAGHLSADRNF